MGKITIGVIGLGRMGKMHLRALLANADWDVKYVCDVLPEKAKSAHEIAPDALFTTNEDDLFTDPELQAVCLCTLADARLAQIEKAVRTGKHIVAEKPVAYSLDEEWKAVDIVESSPVIATVNMYLCHAWYTHEMKRFLETGDIGDLAIIRICHMTPGLAPGEGHEYEGPAFHDCGMHYVNIARWFADSDFKTGHAQAVRMWDYKDPWWLQCHGTFANGVVYDITQGFVYGQLSKDQTHTSYMELIGTKGFVRMHHDFHTAVVEEHGVTTTQRIERPYGGKNIGRLYELVARAIRRQADAEPLPTFRQSVLASEFAWKMLDNARQGDLPSKGTDEELVAIRDRRAHMTDGYGLLHKNDES
ncbi:MAG: Gfo/Idh/MocA family oxidoreductase [Bacteroidaceae bacterium]|nr:Gfo/Idh/MocA family oxidoreductase [Bacteroidaceae bacterium]